MYFAISFSSLDFLFLFTYVIVTGFMNLLQLNPAQNLFPIA
ncbi:membrane protein [Escherichia coli]|nr:membrane protein [Escherichia coli]AHM46709.1 membrane protein [Escherichia coli]AHM51263.1 membrane protein [Escherichia coli]